MGRIFLGRATRSPRLAALLACGAAALGLAFFSARAPAQPAAAPVVDPSQYLYDLGFKFQLAQVGCNKDAGCHSSATRKARKAGSEPYVDNSFTLWNKAPAADAPADPHRFSFTKLNIPLAKDIAKKLNLASSKDAKCLACHAINPPAALLDAQPLLPEGVTCNGCHGPSGPKTTGGKGWKDLHTEFGWHAQKRQQPHAQVLKEVGFFDTKPLIERAERCVSCHLAIDPAMVAAGHPQPTFELNWFSVTYPNRHWDDPTDKYFAAQLWAAGQVVALRDAMLQLESRAKADAAGKDDANIRAAYSEAYSHYMVLAPLAPTIKADLTGVNAALTAASRSLTGAATRAALATAAHGGADAVTKLFPAVQAWVPDKTSDLAVLKAVMDKAGTADTLGIFGMEQARDAIFALYSAYATSADGGAPAQANVDAIGAALFFDPSGKPVAPKELKADFYKAGLEKVKALKM